MDRLLTVNQVCEWLQVKPSTVYKWVHYGYIPHVKIGSLTRFHGEKVELWLRKRAKRGMKAVRIDL